MSHEEKSRELKSQPYPGQKTHNLSRTAEYKCWQDMIQRCENPKLKAYVNYGGRGISVSKEWRISFTNFINDVGFRPSASHTLDRTDNDKGYSKENCKWATRSDQMRNQRPRNGKKFKGVYYNGIRKKYIARIYMDGLNKYIGSFDTEAEAGIAFKIKNREIYGK